jgi:2-octaprenyl-6-methoxyphenol hydroxylase
VADHTVDVLIIGGGLAGATLLIALQGMGYRCLLVEAKSFVVAHHNDFDARSLALSPASQRILAMLGVWQDLSAYATPIEFIHVSEQKGFGVSRIQGSQKEPLGYVLEMQHIQAVLYQLLDQSSLLAPATLTTLDLNNHEAVVQTPEGSRTISAQLIVAADGADSMVRKLCNMPAQTRHYRQQALVANIGLQKAHQQKAYERFTEQGPMALLPMSDRRMSLVWAMEPARAKQMMSCDDRTFINELQQAFGYRAGRFVKAGQRFSYPLKQVIMQQQVKWPVVFVGNAAHTLHPVAGQGFNLGLRDIATLAQCLGANGLKEEAISHYLQLRRPDQQVISRCTDGLIQIFTSQLPGLRMARNLGLLAMDHFPFLKNSLTRYARGFGGFVPDLACEMPLTRKELE